MGHGAPRPYVSRRQFLRSTAMTGLVTASSPFFWKQLAYAQEVRPEQVHVQFGADASRSAAFSWMTPAPVRDPFLQLGEQRLPAETVQYDGYPGFFHHVRVDDLLPGTDYQDGDYVSDLGTMYVVTGNGGGVQRGEGLGGGSDWTARIAPQEVGTLRIDVFPDTGQGTKRLVLGEYSVNRGGAPIEEGIVIERTRTLTAAPTPPATDEPDTPAPTPLDTTPTPTDPDTVESTPLPATGSPAGITAIGVAAAATAAAGRAWLRDTDDEEVAELRARRRDATTRGLRQG